MACKEAMGAYIEKTEVKPQKMKYSLDEVSGGYGGCL
jgi:hypothetical protein